MDKIDVRIWWDIRRIKVHELANDLTRSVRKRVTREGTIRNCQLFGIYADGERVGGFSAHAVRERKHFFLIMTATSDSVKITCPHSTVILRYVTS